MGETLTNGEKSVQFSSITNLQLASGEKKNLEISENCWLPTFVNPSPRIPGSTKCFSIEFFKIFWFELVSIWVWIIVEVVLNWCWIGFQLVLNWFWIVFKLDLNWFWIEFELVWNRFCIELELILNWFQFGFELLLKWF